MKLIPLILASIILFAGMLPKNSGFMHCEMDEAELAMECDVNKDKHACCKLPIEEEQKDHAPEKEPCGDSCDCYCCILVIAPVIDLTPPSSYVHVEMNQRKLWANSSYSFEFTDLIWQPPQASL